MSAWAETITLGELRSSRRLVLCTCRDCRHRAEVASEALIVRLGGQARAGWAARVMRCSRCGSRNVATQAGQVPRHPRLYPVRGASLNQRRD